MTLKFAAADAPVVPLIAVEKAGLERAIAALNDLGKTWVLTNKFTGASGEICAIPGTDGQLVAALVGMGDAKSRARSRFVIGGARPRLPVSTYRLAEGLAGCDLEEAALGWLLAGYRFDAYKKPGKTMAGLIAPDGIDATRLETIAGSEALTRDLINTPASDMGPEALEKAARELAGEFAAAVNVIADDALLQQNLPMIHAVGRAAGQAPRLIDLTWGNGGPPLVLVGKGVCFDTGGLNIKPGASMGLMKKDMGGAATVLGLARMIMALGLNVCLRVLIPAVENAISAQAMRPGDILGSRKGLSVEINNTDAEGRLVLADALALADEDEPDMIISMATLTGAARVAVGPDLVPFFTTDDSDASAVQRAATAVRDPVWRLPFWDAYEPMIEPDIADLDNAPKGGFAGSITAALFLRRFVTGTARYLHFDIFGWNPTAAPARPKGGVGQGARALLEALPGMLKL